MKILGPGLESRKRGFIRIVNFIFIVMKVLFFTQFIFESTSTLIENAKLAIDQFQRLQVKYLKQLLKRKFSRGSSFF